MVVPVAGILGAISNLAVGAVASKQVARRIVFLSCAFLGAVVATWFIAGMLSD
jgi:hypothetical protein